MTKKNKNNNTTQYTLRSESSHSSIHNKQNTQFTTSDKETNKKQFNVNSVYISVVTNINQY